jgi:hypothetical protein
MSDMQHGYRQAQENYAPKHQQQQKPVIVRPAPAVPPGKLIAGGVILLLVIVAAIVGYRITSGSSIAVGDCVVTSPNVVTQWDIKKVACNSDPGSALSVQKVVSVQDGSNGECGFGLTTFRDDPASKTYCLSDFSFGNGG